MDNETDQPKARIKFLRLHRLDCIAAGIFLGYMLSFVFQHEFIRKFGLWFYLEHFIDILFKSNARISITGWCGLWLGGVGGELVARRLFKKEKSKECEQESTSQKDGE